MGEFARLTAEIALFPGTGATQKSPPDNAAGIMRMVYRILLQEGVAPFRVSVNISSAKGA